MGPTITVTGLPRSFLRFVLLETPLDRNAQSRGGRSNYTIVTSKCEPPYLPSSGTIPGDIFFSLKTRFFVINLWITHMVLEMSLTHNILCREIEGGCSILSCSLSYISYSYFYLCVIAHSETRYFLCVMWGIFLRRRKSIPISICSCLKCEIPKGWSKLDGSDGKE